MKKTLLAISSVILSAMMSLPVLAQTTGSIRIAAHRGFWKCDETKHAENSIASLKTAQENNFWGSEFDIHITADDQIVVHHDDYIQGQLIWTNTFDSLLKYKLNNGETMPTLDAYLSQGELYPETMLVLEFKSQQNEERENKMVDMTFDKLKAHGLYDPSRVMFISFSMNVCKRVAKLAPEFTKIGRAHV